MTQSIEQLQLGQLPTRKDIYGGAYKIAGAILLTDERTSKQKYFIVAFLDYANKFGVKLCSDFNVTQKRAASMQQIQFDAAQYCEFRSCGKVFWRYQSNKQA
jgi:hypothetical protein